MGIHAKPSENPDTVEEYQSMTVEWEAYFASQKYAAKDNEWRTAVLDMLTQMNILEDQHRTDPYMAIRAVANEGTRRARLRRSTD